MKAALAVICTSAIVSGTPLAFATTEAAGRECNGIHFPEQVQVEGRTLSLNGLGLRQATIFKVNVYVGALYVASKSSDPAALLAADAPMMLVLHFVRDVGASSIASGWDEGFEKRAAKDLPALKERIATLKNWMADVKAGQRLTFVVVPGKGVQVDVNGAAKGTIEGADFTRAFLSIWLGPEPPNAEIKTGLLGGACD
jgi:hypothetical protein